ncbi:MarR family winged helix-turn-helix transcriptional regulator [Peredibacter sp. HCB2-198]|uniref:MarR family winged helix-turn-helix transcriptional regulator n=1 Tax=Peredibacter sp. HCB2-198 TaxID=3383025 RepID=UPI0038B6104E
MLSKSILSVVPYSIRTIRRFTAAAITAPLSFQQLRILILIKEGKGQTEMADLLQVSTAAISKMISQLEIKKYALRMPGKDRRSLELKLTKEGTKVLNKVFGKLEDRFEKNIKRLSKQEQADLGKGLIVLEKLMGFVNEV